MTRASATRIGDVIRRIRRPVEVDPTSIYEEVGIRSFGRGFFPKPPVTGADLGNKSIFEIRRGDLTLNIVFAWEGAVALASDAEHGRVASHRFPTYAADPQLCDARYMLHFLISEQGRDLLEKASPGSAGRNRTLNLKTFESFPLHLPSIDEQRRMADRIDSISVKVQALESMWDPYVKARASLTATIFNRCSQSAPHAKLGEVLTLARDEVPVELDQTYRTAGIYSFGRGLLARPPIAGTDTKYATLFRLHEGQFVLSRLNGWEGAVAVVPSEFDGFVVSQEYPTFNINRERAEPAYFGWLCRWDRFWEALAPRGSMVRRKRTHPDRLLAVEIPLPSLEEQRRLGVLAQTVQTLGQRAEEFSAIGRALVPAVANAALQGDL